MAVTPASQLSPVRSWYATAPTMMAGMPETNTATSFCSVPPSASWHAQQAVESDSGG